MIYEILWQSLVAGLATVLGALVITALGRPDKNILAFFLGFAGGIMTAVIVFDLIPSALAYGSFITTSAGFLLGLIFMFFLDIVISAYPSFQNEPISQNSQLYFLKMGYLIAAGIALHDLPEGIAIAVGYSAKDSLGLLIALAIGLHNIPEGMATAAPLIMGGMSCKNIILTCLFISLFTPVGACIGILLISVSPDLICLLLALAGGAMAFIVKSELIPQSLKDYPLLALFGFILGIIIIFSLGYLHH